MANMNEPGTGSYPTMGISAAQLSRVGTPKVGKSRPKGHGKGGSDAFLGTKSNRGQSHGSMGASMHPTTALYAPNAASAQDTLRRVVQMPSKSSWTDNWRSAARAAQG